MISTSGNKEFDNSTLYAIEKSSPFDPIPSEYASYIDAKHIFEISGFNQE